VVLDRCVFDGLSNERLRGPVNVREYATPAGFRAAVEATLRERARRLGDLALLELALYRFALARVREKRHVPLLPPVLVREEAMYGTGFFRQTRSILTESNETSSTSWVLLRCRSRHSIRGRFSRSCPSVTVAYSTCFRREAGAAGQDTRGMFRVHQFDKVERFVYCVPEASGDEHDRLLAIEEGLVKELDLPYRAINVAAGDVGAPAVKKFDIEAWFLGGVTARSRRRRTRPIFSLVDSRSAFVARGRQSRTPCAISVREMKASSEAQHAGKSGGDVAIRSVRLGRTTSRAVTPVLPRRLKSGRGDGIRTHLR
jgi:hypothetical protein